MAKEVAKQEPVGLPAEMMDLLQQDAGAGFEQVTKDDLLIPFLRILQAMSPATKKRESTYIEGAEEGMFINSALGTLWDGAEGISIIPCAFARRYVEWEPGGNGKLIADHGSDSKILERATVDGPRWKIGNNVLQLSGDFYVLYMRPDGDWGKAIISLAKTQYKKSRRWLTALTDFTIVGNGGKRFNPPMWYRTWKMTAVPESNDQGSWFGFKMEPSGLITSVENFQDVYQIAKGFHDQVSSGAVRSVPLEDEGPEGASAPDVI